MRPSVEVLVDYYMNLFGVDANYFFGIEDSRRADSIDARLDELPMEAREYLWEVFTEMIEKWPG